MALSPAAPGAPEGTHQDSRTVPPAVGRPEGHPADESPAVGLPGQGETEPGTSDLMIDVVPVGLAAPVGSDLIGEFSLPPVVNEVAAAVERFAVRVEDEVGDGGETWAVVIGLTVLAGEIARRQLRRDTHQRTPEAGRWGNIHAC